MLVNNLPSPPEMKVSRVIFVRAFNCSSWSSPNKCICWPWVDCLQGRESDSKNTLSRNDWASNTYINTKINTFLWLQFFKKKSVNIAALIESHSSPHLSLHIVHHVPCIWSLLGKLLSCTEHIYVYIRLFFSCREETDSVKGKIKHNIFLD